MLTDINIRPIGNAYIQGKAIVIQESYLREQVADHYTPRYVAAFIRANRVLRVIGGFGCYAGADGYDVLVNYLNPISINLLPAAIQRHHIEGYISESDAEKWRLWQALTELT